MGRLNGKLAIVTGAQFFRKDVSRNTALTTHRWMRAASMRRCLRLRPSTTDNPLKFTQEQKEAI